MTIRYIYDANGIQGFYVKTDTATTRYYYVKNMLGDIIGIADDDGVLVAQYTYNAYGKIMSITDGSGNDVSSDRTHIANVNPFRYKGYYYDIETGFYYLQSRYYDPETGRFINADGYVSTGQGILGNNMFAYCLNNPVNRADSTGQLWITAGLCILGGIALGVLTGCDEPSKSTSSSRPRPKPPKPPTPSSSTSSNASSPSASSSTSSSSNGISVHKRAIRICTDGSDGERVPDKNWLPDAAHNHNGKPIDAYTVPYVVIPLGDNSAKLGDSALLINHDTGLSVRCVVGERGPKRNGWGEVSIAAIWATGNPEHNTANHTTGLSSNYEIILYPGERFKWSDD